MTPITVEEKSDLTALDVQEKLLNLWLDGKAPETQKMYRRYANSFLNYLGKPIHLATLQDLVNWRLTFKGCSNSTIKNITSVVKSLFSFASQMGILPVNVAAPFTQVKSGQDTVNEKILTEFQVQSMIAFEKNQRNRLILRLLYSGGLRVSEISQLKWKDLKPRENGGQVTVYGKGGKTRTILVKADLWNELQNLRGSRHDQDAVFKSRKQAGHLNRFQLHKIVKAAGERIGIKGVSPHWLRHSHASHSLDRGAPIHLVQQSLGHASVATTSRYLHSRPNDCSSLYLP